MKTLTTMTAVAALIVGMSFANAQNSTTPNDSSPPPSSINAGGQTGTGDSKSGSQSSATINTNKMKTGAKDPSGKPAPGSLNAGAQTGTGDSKSGNQSAATGNMKASSKNMHVVGKAKFCITQAKGSNDLECKYASMQACNKEAKQMNRTCTANPKMAGAGMKQTTGMEAK